MPLVYTLNIELNLLESDPDYPKEPKTLGERIRKTRMDRGLYIRELANRLGVTSDTIINWEIRGIKPSAANLKKLKVYMRAKNI